MQPPANPHNEINKSAATLLAAATQAAMLSQTGKFLIIMAMVAIGLNTPLRELTTNGVKPILLGLSCWLAVTVASVVAQYYLAIW